MIRTGDDDDISIDLLMNARGLERQQQPSRECAGNRATECYCDDDTASTNLESRRQLSHQDETSLVSSASAPEPSLSTADTHNDDDNGNFGNALYDRSRSESDIGGVGSSAFNAFIRAHQNLSPSEYSATSTTTNVIVHNVMSSKNKVWIE